MGIEEALFKELSEDATLSALIGTRIYPTKKPQKATVPCVTYRRISHQDYHAFGADAEVETARFQLDSWGNTKTEATTVANAVLGALRRWMQEAVDGGDTKVYDCRRVNQTDLYDDALEQHNIAQDYIIDYSES